MEPEPPPKQEDPEPELPKAGRLREHCYEFKLRKNRLRAPAKKALLRAPQQHWSYLVDPADGILLDHGQVDLVTHQVPDKGEGGRINYSTISNTLSNYKKIFAHTLSKAGLCRAIQPLKWSASARQWCKKPCKLLDLLRGKLYNSQCRWIYFFPSLTLSPPRTQEMFRIETQVGRS